MDERDAHSGSRLVVRVPVEPVEAAAEADAVDALRREGVLMLRGPLFGVAAQSAEDGGRWRVVSPITSGCPQSARDSLNSLLWHRAYTGGAGPRPGPPVDRAVRRELLAAVARLETETVDELLVAGTRYRVVRAEEYAVAGPDGLEGPRPTDPQPPKPDWARGRGAVVDDGLVLDVDAPVSPATALEQLALRNLHYTGARFPDPVRADSEVAVGTHPDVLSLPAVFTLVEQAAGGASAGWKAAGGAHATAHDARKSLDFAFVWMLPRLHGLIPEDALDADATTYRTTDGRPDPALAPYAEASAALRAGLLTRLEFLGTVHQIARARRLLRWGPDGPEGPRPSDVNSQPPTQLHLRLDEDGRVIPEA
ncbi:DUF5954 family protein [Yinghuangia seranimata]|uniref:DUF5954 family protein n=1 Tax=Yinghuangia seranimata TaxID=408067 RepID=UPI00248BB544|nr:DUF5954 family protein [Yinghuangia seranimata]MDI2131273.1 DUF5954 family protein [Yinghuangia seranimata]